VSRSSASSTSGRPRCRGRLARDTAQQPGDYNLAKNDVIDTIYARIFSQPAG
jgi:hypothetical protein